MSAFLIARINVHDEDRYLDYVGQVPAFVEKHGGQYRVRGGDAATIEGEPAPGRLVVIEFPDRQHALGFVNDPEYAPVAAIRHSAASTQMIVADGYAGD
jgi:uncharacterized protein (DUF1330 family)